MSTRLVEFQQRNWSMVKPINAHAIWNLSESDKRADAFVSNLIIRLHDIYAVFLHVVVTWWRCEVTEYKWHMELNSSQCITD